LCPCRGMWEDCGGGGMKASWMASSMGTFGTGASGSPPRDEGTLSLPHASTPPKSTSADDMSSDEEHTSVDDDSAPDKLVDDRELLRLDVPEMPWPR